MVETRGKSKSVSNNKLETETVEEDQLDIESCGELNEGIISKEVTWESVLCQMKVF